MKKLSITSKLTLVVGFISSFIAGLATIFIIQFVFHSIEGQIQNDLSNHHSDIKLLATPEKSEELANYLRSNDLSLFIYNNNQETVARYGIYRNLDSKTLSSFIDISLYEDRNILDYGEYDIYTKDNIQVAVKNNVLYILKKSFYISLVVLLPIVWVIAVIVSNFATKVILSPLLLAKNISHELKTPLARVATTLQVIMDDAPKNIKNKIRYSVDELVQLGNNVDSLLSLSILNKKEDEQNKYTNIKRGIDKFLINIPKDIKQIVTISSNMIIPIDSNYMNIIFRNLIDNAVKYNIDNGYILIKAIKTKSNWFIEIVNPTHHIKNKNGYGLGLTIVEDICHKNNLNYLVDITNKKFIVKIEGKLVKFMLK